MKKVFKVLDGATHFVPDVVLVLAVLSLFGNFGGYDIIVSAVLFISYIALSYAERMYFKVNFVKTNITDLIMKQFQDVEEQINAKKFITLDGMLRIVDVMEDAVDEKIDRRLEDLFAGVQEEFGVEDDEMDTEESIQEV